MWFTVVVSLPLLGRRFFGGELSAWSSIRRQITQHELYRRQEKRCQFRCLEKCGSVTHGAIKNASLTITLDPTGGVVVVGTHVPSAHIRFIRIYTGQHMQFLPGVRAGGKEMVKLIGVGEASSTERFGELAADERLGQWTSWIINLQGHGLHFVRAVLRADQLAKFRYVLRSVAGGMKTRKAAAFTNISQQAVHYHGIHGVLTVGAVQEDRIILLDFRILQIVQIIIENRFISASLFPHQPQSQIAVRDGVVVITPGWAYVHDQKFPGLYRFCRSFFG